MDLYGLCWISGPKTQKPPGGVTGGLRRVEWCATLRLQKQSNAESRDSVYLSQLPRIPCGCNTLSMVFAKSAAGGAGAIPV